MRIQFDVAPESGLRVVPEIAIEPRALLEGRNGIGKTLAVRLLQLLAGSQPYLNDSAAWTSLRQYLGSASVRVTDLLGDHPSFEATFTPGDWPEEPPQVIGEWLASVTVGASAAQVEDLAKVLSVERMAGNETLADSLAQRRSYLASAVSTTREDVSSRLTALQEVVGKQREDLEAAAPASEASDLAAAEDVDRQVARLTAEANEQRTELSKLERIRRAASVVERLRLPTSPDAPDAEAVSARRDQVAEDIKKLAQELAASPGPSGDLGKIEKRVEGRRRRRDRLTDELAAAVRDLGLPASGDAVNDELLKLRSQLRELHQELASADKSGPVLELLTDVLPTLTEAEDDGLGDQLVAEVEAVRVRISQLREGMTKRRNELAHGTPPDQVASLQAQMTAIQGAVQHLEAASETHSAIQRIDELNAEDEAEAAALRKALAGRDQRAERLRELTAEHGELQRVLGESIAALAGRVTAVGAGGEASSLEEAEQDFEAALKEVGGDVEAADARYAALSEEIARLTVAIGDAREEHARLTTRARERKRRRSRLSRDIAAERQWEWARTANPGLVASLEASEDERDGAITSLLDTVSEVDDRVIRLAEALDVLSSALSLHAGAASPTASVRWADEIGDLLSGELADTLRAEPITEALFDGGHVDDVSVSDETVSWTSSSGVRTTRPWTAFSSGDQAFAFTQARIRQLEPSATPNRLLALDEFGAYISADRLDDLRSLLHATQVGQVATHVLVVLPLHVDYVQEAEFTTGALRETYLSRAGSVTSQGYFVEQWT